MLRCWCGDSVKVHLNAFFLDGFLTPILLAFDAHLVYSQDVTGTHLCAAACSSTRWLRGVSVWVLGSALWAAAGDWRAQQQGRAHTLQGAMCDVAGWVGLGWVVLCSQCCVYGGCALLWAAHSFGLPQAPANTWPLYVCRVGAKGSWAEPAVVVTAYALLTARQ